MRISSSGGGRWRRSILGNLRTEVLMSSIRISISEGGGSILGNLRAKVPKGGGVFFAKITIYCVIFSTKSSHWTQLLHHTHYVCGD